MVIRRSPRRPASIGPPDRTTAGRSTRAAAISAAGTVLSQPTRQTSASKSCASVISSIESAITSRETSDARMPGVPCDWLSETAIVLNSSATPPAASTACATRAARRRWLRLHGIVPVHVDAIPTTGPSSRSGSMPIARKCERAGARSAPDRSAARARRRAGASSMAASLVVTAQPHERCDGQRERQVPVARPEPRPHGLVRVLACGVSSCVSPAGARRARRTARSSARPTAGRARSPSAPPRPCRSGAPGARSRRGTRR